MTEFFYALGDFSYSIFNYMPTVGGVINASIMIIISILFLYWMVQLLKFRSQGGLE